MTADIPRLSDDELTALLEAHKPVDSYMTINGEPADACSYCDNFWPCETWRLATEVRDLRAVKAQMEEMIHECDSTMHWRKGGMRPTTDISIFAYVPLSGVIKIRRYFSQALARYEEGGR